MEKLIKENRTKYSVSIDFENVSLPPFEDILILAKRCPVGKAGISRCLNLLAPDDFELIDIDDDDNIEAILINNKILKRLPDKKIIEILKSKVFPYVTNGELVKVDFKVKISFEKIEGFLE